jgi:plasmid stability protein
VGKLTRRNYLVDEAKVRDLAARKGTSASAAVREAVDFALAAEEVMAAIQELHARGGLDDPFGRLPDEHPDAA